MASNQNADQIAKLRNPCEKPVHTASTMARDMIQCRVLDICLIDVPNHGGRATQSRLLSLKSPTLLACVPPSGPWADVWKG